MIENVEKLVEVGIWLLGGTGVLALFIKNWQTIKPYFACFSRNKANQKMLEDHEDKLTEIQEDVKTIKKNLNDLETNSREYRKTSLSDKIFKKYQSYKKADQITRDQLENFNICIERYKKCLLEDEIESDVVLNKYLVEVMELEVIE